MRLTKLQRAMLADVAGCVSMWTSTNRFDWLRLAALDLVELRKAPPPWTFDVSITEKGRAVFAETACCLEFATGSGQHNGCERDEATR